MNFVVIGTDHRFQNREPGLHGLLTALCEVTYSDPLAAIAEEYHDKIGISVAQRIANDADLRWFNLSALAGPGRKLGPEMRFRGQILG
jgi:hypothetical protein